MTYRDKLDPGLQPSLLSDRWDKLPWVVALGLLLRLLVVLLTERSLHPDEIIQYVEQAHRLTYGYGYVPWEYVYGIRSWLLPGAISLLLSGGRWLGLSEPSTYIPLVQIVACLISLSVIYCLYWLGRTLMSESAGRIASVLAAGWYELVIRASTLTPEVVGTYLLLAALTCLVIKPTAKTALLLGLCCAGAVALRLQYAPAALVVMLLGLMYVWQKRWSLRELMVAFTGFAAVVAFTGWLDDYMLGGYWVSYYNNYLYNKVYGISSLWGNEPLGYYVLMIGLYSGGVFWLSIAHSLRRKRPKPWILLALLAAVVLPHMLIGHKEYRFIFAAVPICLLLSARMIDDLWQVRTGPQRSWGKAILGLMAFYAIATLFITSVVIEPKSPQLRAYFYLHDQPQLVSVLNLSGEWYLTGGYYYLHRDVPIYMPYHLDGIAPTDWQRYISHIVCKHDQAPIVGFTPITQLGPLDIRVANQPPTATLAIETRYPPQAGVSNVFKPRVTPRF